MRRFFLILLLIFMPLYIFLKAMEINIFNKNFYLKFYEKYNVMEISHKNLNELDNITEDIFIYLRDKGDEKLLKPYFNNNEIKHMEDVKLLFKGGYTLKYMSFILSIISLLFIFKNKDWTIIKKFFIIYLYTGAL